MDGGVRKGQLSFEVLACIALVLAFALFFVTFENGLMEKEKVAAKGLKNRAELEHEAMKTNYYYLDGRHTLVGFELRNVTEWEGKKLVRTSGDVWSYAALVIPGIGAGWDGAITTEMREAEAE